MYDHPNWEAFVDMTEGVTRMSKHHEFTIELNVTTTGGHLSVDMYPLDEADLLILAGTDEGLVNDPEVIAQLKSAVFGVLRNLKFNGK